MNHDDWPEDTMEVRRAAIRETIRTATYEELMALAEKRFPVATDPWCVRFNQFLQDHKNSKFYRAEIPGGAQIIYSRDAEKGVWFLPDSGMGIIQPKGLKALEEIVDAL